MGTCGHIDAASLRGEGKTRRRLGCIALAKARRSHANPSPLLPLGAGRSAGGARGVGAPPVSCVPSNLTPTSKTSSPRSSTAILTARSTISRPGSRPTRAQGSSLKTPLTKSRSPLCSPSRAREGRAATACSAGRPNRASGRPMSPIDVADFFFAKSGLGRTMEPGRSERTIMRPPAPRKLSEVRGPLRPHPDRQIRNTLALLL